MSRPIQIVDEQDRPVSEATKQEARAKGLRHRVVRVMIENDQGQVLLQHRSPTKDIFANCWDNSAAGHVDAGESYEEAVMRELAEEIGVHGMKPEFMGQYESNEIREGHHLVRFNRVYRLGMNETPRDLEPGKVDGVKWFRVEEMKKLVAEHPGHVSDGLQQVVERYYS